jgi:hypothetical protein
MEAGRPLSETGRESRSCCVVIFIVKISSYPLCQDESSKMLPQAIFSNCQNYVKTTKLSFNNREIHSYNYRAVSLSEPECFRHAWQA